MSQYNYEAEPFDLPSPLFINTQEATVYQQEAQWINSDKDYMMPDEMVSGTSQAGSSTGTHRSTTSAERQRNRLQHVCQYADCDRAFTRKAELERHVAVSHNEVVPNRAVLQLFSCEYPGCHRRGDRGFTSKDKMIAHMRDVHEYNIDQRPRARPTPTKRETAASETSKRKGSGIDAGLRFATINHPDELRNKDQMREIRRHVMHTYLDKEAQGPGSEQAASKSLPEQMLPTLRKLEETVVADHISAGHDSGKPEPRSSQSSDPYIRRELDYDCEDEQASSLDDGSDRKGVPVTTDTATDVFDSQSQGHPSSELCMDEEDLELPKVSPMVSPLHKRAILSKLLRYLRPRIPKGYQRLEWTCSCGKAMYGDYAQDEAMMTSTLFRSLPGCKILPTSTRLWLPGISQLPLFSAISNISQAARTRVANEQTESATMTMTTPFNNATNNPFQPTNPSRADLGNEEINRPGPKVRSPLRVYGPLSSSEKLPCFLELCVNRNRSQISLGEIQVCTAKGEQLVTGDQQLFGEIRRRYSSLRRRGLYKLLYRPFTVHFVRFGVQRGGYQTGIYQSPLSIPPQIEVAEGRYHYYECPLDPLPPIDARTFFHYFWDHDAHPECSGHPGFDSLFYNRLPKKLGTSMLLQTTPDKLHLGWGVHIVEGPNKPLLAWMATAILVLSFLVSLLYDIGMKNKDSGFAIGQWMVATLATTLMAVYFHLGDMA